MTIKQAVTRAMHKPKPWQEHLDSDTEYAIYIKNRELVIWFEGSACKLELRSLIDWFQNFNFFCVNTEIGRFHRGLWYKYFNIRHIIIDYITNHFDDFDSICMTGFSQGGGLAQICYFDICNHFFDESIDMPVSCIAVGSPKVSRKSGLLTYFADRLIRINVNGDIVPFLPPFHHAIGKEIMIGKKRLIPTPWRHWWTNYRDNVNDQELQL